MPKGEVEQFVEQQDSIWNIWFERRLKTSTSRSWVMNEFRKQKRELRDDLREARSNIHLSFDLWTSPNFYAMIAIVAHYIDKNGARQTKLLALRRLEGEHTGANQAQIVLNVIGEYKIGGRIGYFMLDNASSNDTAVDLILKTLYPKKSAKQRKRRRLRCLGHIVNLCAQAFLLGKKADTTLEELELAYNRHDFESITKIWRKQGALGRLHNIIRYIRMSPQRREEFRKIVGGDWSLFDKLELIQSNATRWNSYFSSIVHAINCKQRIQQFCESHRPKRGNGVENDCLTSHHWFLLQKLSSVLQPFYEATMCGQGHKHTLYRWFTTMDWHLDCTWNAQVDFKKHHVEYNEHEEYAYLEAAACASWEKCEEYYNLADDSAAYYAAQVLLPNKKWWWFHQRFEGNDNKKYWLTGRPEDPEDHGVLGLVENLWLEEYKGRYSTPTSIKPLAPAKFTSGETFGGLRNHEQIKAVPFRSDAYQSYIRSDPEQIDDPLAYWNSLYLSQPDLARFALDMLAIPLMSAECERVFSSAKHLLTDPRLKVDMVEANECLKSWFGRPQAKAFVKGVDPDVDELYEEAVAKATAEEKCKVTGEADIPAGEQQAGQEDRQEDGQEDGQEDELEDEQDDEDDEDEDEDDVVKYTILD